MRTLFYIALGVLYLIWSPMFIQNMVLISLVLLIAQMSDFLWHLGRKIKPLDLMVLFANMFYLLAPALSYAAEGSMWYKGISFMPIVAEEYFNVAFPGALALMAGLCFPFKSALVDHKVRMEEVVTYLQERRDAGVTLFWVGVACTVLVPFAPSALAQFVDIGSHLIYIGGLYIFFARDKNRYFFLAAMFLLPIVKSIRYGMFGELMFWGIFLVLMLLIRYKVSLILKVGVLAAGVLLIIFIQSIKYELRIRTWYDENTTGLEARFDVFKELLVSRIAHPDTLISDYAMSAVLDRTNQGMLTGMAIRYVPVFEPYAKGETIFLATFASFVPRAVWPDKPILNGHENMRRFTGFTPFETTAMDIGQLGDAYVNFGSYGGAVFMFFYGLFYAFVLAMLFKLSESWSPAALLWIPLFFAGCIQVETSVLQTFNHLIKSGMFFFLVYWAFKRYLKIQL